LLISGITVASKGHELLLWMKLLNIAQQFMIKMPLWVSGLVCQNVDHLTGVPVGFSWQNQSRKLFTPLSKIAANQSKETGMENWIITSRQTFEEKLDNPHQRFKFHSSLIFGFTGVIAKHTKVDMIWVAGRSPTLVSHSLRGVATNLKATTLAYLAIVYHILNPFFPLLSIFQHFCCPPIKRDKTLCFQG
jgi:hypothetical protein